MEIGIEALESMPCKQEAPAEIAERNERMSRLEEAMKKLTEKEKYLIKKLVEEDQSARELSKDDAERQRLLRKRNDILAKIKYAMSA